ncbi:MAG: PEGA domain-containing protein [Persephonella sp.]|nr:PEGA domain-containing protein [Persephonella sp.]
MMRKVLLASLVSVNLAFASATILKGTSQNVSITTEPPGATVYVDGQVMGTTPVTLSLPKNKYHKIAVEKECYQRVEVPLGKKYDPIALLNIFWDLSTTDFITGAAWEYSPNSYHIKLKKKPDCKSK